MTEKILILVATKDRQSIARHCFENLAAVKGANDILTIFNDHSVAYDGRWCRLFADQVFNTTESIGIHRQRVLHFQYAAKLLAQDKELTRVYLTDADTLHDPAALTELCRIQDKYDGALTCGYNTTAHSCLEGNTWRDDPSEEVIWRKYAPGVSYMLTRDHVDVLMPHLKYFEKEGWDWCAPTMLGNRCAITRVGYVDHIGIGGDHHPGDATANEGDKVIAPTPFLIRKRAEVVAELSRTNGAFERPPGA